MGGCEEYRNEGWYITQEGYNVITENGMLKARKPVLENALNTDIKEFGEPILSNLLRQEKTGKVVLQIQKIKNVSVPKSKEDSQSVLRMLKLILSDGHTSCQAIEISNIPQLDHLRTPPGSKLLINNAKILLNSILLDGNCCIVLGGHVSVLFERWELAKNMSKHIRTTAGMDGPPPWVNFGQQIISSIGDEAFKALSDKAAKETTNEFDIHRQDAIASATNNGAVKKVFGGGPKIALDNQTVNLKKGNINSSRNTHEHQEYQKNYKSKRDNKEKSNEKSQKPTDKVSLFDFLEDKLHISENDNKVKSTSVSATSLLTTTVSYDKPNLSETYHYNSKSYSNYYPKKDSEIKNKPNINNSSNINETSIKNVEKHSLNSQFATKSLQNLGVIKKKAESKNFTTNSSSPHWKIGDLCIAKYWEDGKFYEATVTNLTERTCVVKFNGYGNIEEVLKVDCHPISDASMNAHRGPRRTYTNNRSYNNNRSFNYKTT